MSSRLLGENVEKIRDELTVDELEGEELIAVKGTRSHENDELFERSVLAISSSSQSSSLIHQHILAEGVSCITIKPLGGQFHLVTFASIEDKKAILESNWLDNWFINLSEVNDGSASKWKETRIRIYGVPLKSWSYENFYNIGSIFGRVLSVEYSNFNVAKILLLTDCLFTINCKLILDIDGKKSKIFVSEEPIVQMQTGNQAQKTNFQSSSDEDSGGEEFTPSTNFSSPKGDNYGNSFPNVDVNVQVSPKKTLELSNHFSEPHDNNKPIIETKQLIISPNKNYSLSLSPPTATKVKKSDSLVTSPTSQKADQPICPSPSPLSRNTSPRVIQKSPISVPSPLPISNMFGPLFPKPHNPNIPKNQSSSSSLSSGPMFPPGFESMIPSEAKIRHAQKRIKKLQKRKKRKLPSHSSTPLSSINITAENVISLASELGLKIDGPTSCIENLISAILKSQYADWEASKA